ncbi:hypothetical protein C2857_007428 [Epichloe festucae Fl1]|uniref:Short-chain dehydrogenase/reductase n=1 Tax=Epichloe festucae (strain Fl1) TaxID=877507 RepID=A0A7S9KME4_EPIFF|nr:hypothetical protein C2857_007428 [Epichloe festucae Fl1]
MSSSILKLMTPDKASIPFDPSTDIPSLQGKVILVTGGNNGLGKQTICEFAKHGPKQIWLAARNVATAQKVVDEIHAALNPDADADASASVRILVLELDLTSFASVKRAAQRFTTESDRLDILMLNAGIMAAAPAVTEDGYEVQFGTNHMGHALLTKLLLPTLQRSAAARDGADVRVVVLSSRAAHFLAPKQGIRFDSLKTTAADMKPFERYGQSKLANVLFARQLAARHPGLTVVSVHPGVVRTNLVNSMSGAPLMARLLSPIANYWFTPVNQGAKNQLWASVATSNIDSGEYYEPVGVPGKAGRLARNEDLAKELWDWTENELGAWSL